ncbi:MAG: hypothetical protein MZW92_13720 [Comamonadaceae bacterium]|nr:hypothetical protein [Comamonadaceae bacterium]
MLGADHHGYVARVRAGLVAMGEPGDSLEVRLVQFVTLYRGGEKVQMSTRSGEFITLRELRREVGNDAARFFYVMRSNDQHLDFDLRAGDLAVEREPGLLHPVRARARLQRAAADAREGLRARRGPRPRARWTRLVEPHEQALLATMSRYPEVIEMAARAARAARAGALPARARERLPHLLQRPPVPGGRRRACATRASR